VRMNTPDAGPRLNPAVIERPAEKANSERKVLSQMGTPEETQELQQLLRELLASQRLCVLATQGCGQPYGSLVAFAQTEGISALLFATGRRSRKYANFSANPRVALIVDSRSNADTDFSQALAVTATGSAHELHGEERDRMATVYLTKHPSLVAFVGSAETALCRVDVEEYVVAGFDRVVKLLAKG
jgi:nitroimidazol reductase NimA-like FMN-containing flavoprotein (pyridoxamine 5'-phosphate oxidase superfamily)